MIDLKKILDRHPEAAGNSRQMMGLLQDYYPDYENEYEKHIILFFMKSGIVDDLKRKKQNDEIITAADEKKYLTKIEKRYGVQEGTSRPIFRLWIEALELKFDTGEVTERNDDENSVNTPADHPTEPLPPEKPRKKPFLPVIVLIIVVAAAAVVIFSSYQRNQMAENIAATAFANFAATQEESRRQTEQVSTETANQNDRAVTPEPVVITAAPASAMAAAEEPTAAPAAVSEPVIHVGDILTFGSYEQDNNPDNGPEPIEWQVLAVESSRALVISRYGLDAKPYNEELVNVTWETSTVRAWLNGAFYENSFSPEEKVRIQEVLNQNPDNPIRGARGGNDTKDRIFLLSIDEAEQYFRDDKARECRGTEYANANGAQISDVNKKCVWMLRSPGVHGFTLETELDNEFSAEVRADGSVHSQGYFVSDTKSVIRPVFWMDLSGGEEKSVITMSKTSGETAEETVRELERTVIRNYLLYEKPYFNGTVLQSIHSGTQVAVLEKMKSENQMWARIKTEDGLTGWIPETILNTINIGVGDILSFGRYEQDNDLDNGPGMIEWQVLAVEESRALLISRYGLDAKPYNTSYADVTWETCTLRAWLNGAFYKNAFSADEKARILEVTNRNPDNSYYPEAEREADTKDRIFLLSVDEVHKYYPDSGSRVCRPTIYAKENGAKISDFNNNPIWWLRSSSAGDFYARVVTNDGYAGFYGGDVNETGYLVRPAFWLEL